MDLEEVSEEAFGDLVDEVLDELPAEFREHMDNVAFFIEDRSPTDQPPALGVYNGIALTERDSSYGFVPPDTVTLFRENLIECAFDRKELRRQIHITIVHEFAHHFGIDDRRLHELGWG